MAAKDIESATKSAETNGYSPSLNQGVVMTRRNDIFTELKYTLAKDGWIGDYVRFNTISIFKLDLPIARSSI